VPSVDKNLRSKSRKLVFTIKQLGAMVAYADQEPCVQQWLQLMIATAARPDAALAFVPANQWLDSVIDLHPPGAPVTDKRNPIVPAITPLTYVMKGWKLDLVPLAKGGGAPCERSLTSRRVMSQNHTPYRGVLPQKLIGSRRADQSVAGTQGPHRHTRADDWTGMPTAIHYKCRRRSRR
jgi:hypothetical protein